MNWAWPPLHGSGLTLWPPWLSYLQRKKYTFLASNSGQGLSIHLGFRGCGVLHLQFLKLERGGWEGRAVSMVFHRKKEAHSALGVSTETSQMDGGWSTAHFKSNESWKTTEFTRGRWAQLSWVTVAKVREGQALGFMGVFTLADLISEQVAQN